ncbi:MAG: esterase/lipase/thioesterase family active site protein [Pseudomonas sp.]|nr:esterase/lipase/thioesterase family active site protein [Pseudomonas sp.]
MKPIAAAAFLCLVMALGACAPYIPYRTQNAVCETSKADCSNATLQWHASTSASPGDYFLGFVEFNDQGDLWQRQGMEAVIDHLNTEAAAKDLLIVVFVHGWHHSAKEGDGNIDTFRTVLANVAVAEAASGRPAREVAGVYVGWRGDSLALGPINDVTFWDRKNTAEKVGHGEVTELLSRIELVKRTQDSKARDVAFEAKSKSGARSTQSTDENRCGKLIAAGQDVTSQTKLVVIGHSFGGLVVQSSIGQILEDRAIRTKGGDYGCQLDVEGFGNLVVLINPAFEAQRYSGLHDIASQRTWYPPQQLPVEVILTSKADDATGVLFPLGRRFNTVFEREGWDQKNLTTVGHYQPYITHELFKAAPGQLNTQPLMQAWASGGQPSKRLTIAGLTLERTQLGDRNPYLNVSVSGDLIKDHNDIGEPQIIEFLKQMILLSTLPDNDRHFIQTKGQ